VVERRQRRTRDEVAEARVATERERVVQWADSYGAPLLILEGWDPVVGKWLPASPIGQMLVLIQAGNFVSVASSFVGLRSVGAMLAKGSEYMIDATEDRAYIPIDVRPFIDLVREVELAESAAELTLVDVVRKGARSDPKLALAFLSRRFGSRWREQQLVFTSDEIDERDRAVSEALTDPNIALQLAEAAHAIEDRSRDDD